MKLEGALHLEAKFKEGKSGVILLFWVHVD